jgi:hypothetical protein
LVITRICKEGKLFDLSTDDMIRLKKAKVSDAVMKVMLDPNAPNTDPPARITRPVVIQTSTVPGVSTARPSGATPGPAAEACGDPNDPMNPHDSGI